MDFVGFSDHPLVDLLGSESTTLSVARVMTNSIGQAQTIPDFQTKVRTAVRIWVRSSSDTSVPKPSSSFALPLFWFWVHECSLRGSGLYPCQLVGPWSGPRILGLNQAVRSPSCSDFGQLGQIRRSEVHLFGLRTTKRQGHHEPLMQQMLHKARQTTARLLQIEVRSFDEA